MKFKTMPKSEIELPQPRVIARDVEKYELFWEAYREFHVERYGEEPEEHRDDLPMSCPFCRSKETELKQLAFKKRKIEWFECFVECKHCGGRGPVFSSEDFSCGLSQTYAIDDWNRVKR